jgi:cyclopropane-fatty-acyl-phospholipid synthase
VRLWDLYLAYCEAGFRERRIRDVQLLLAKPRWRGDSPATAVATPSDAGPREREAA